MEEKEYFLLEEHSLFELHKFETNPWATGIILGEAFDVVSKMNDGKKVVTYKRVTKKEVIFIFDDESSVKYLIVIKEKNNNNNEKI